LPGRRKGGKEAKEITGASYGAGGTDKQGDREGEGREGEAHLTVGSDNVIYGNGFDNLVNSYPEVLPDIFKREPLLGGKKTEAKGEKNN
jgi:hypothetical protein